MNPAQVQQQVQAARATGSALQQQYDTQATQQYGAYQQSQNQANQAYGNLQNYTDYMKNAGNAANLYQQGIQQGESAQGFDPASLSTATQNLTKTQNALAASQAAS